MTLQEIEALGYQVVCGAIQRGHEVVGRWVDNAPVWAEGYAPEVPVEQPKKTRAKRAVADSSEGSAVDVEDDFSDLLK